MPTPPKELTSTAAVGAPGPARVGTHVDEIRVAGTEVLDVDLQLPARRGQEAGDEHVAPRRQLVQDLPALGDGHVEPDAALAAIGLLHGDAHAVDAGRDAAGAQPALRVAAPRVLGDFPAPNLPPGTAYA